MSASRVRCSIEADVQRVMSERGTGKLGTRGKHVQCPVCSKTVRKLRLHIRKFHKELCPLSCSACQARFVGQSDLNNHHRNGCSRRKHLSYRVTTPRSLIGKHKTMCLIIVTRENFPNKLVTHSKVVERTLRHIQLGEQRSGVPIEQDFRTVPNIYYARKFVWLAIRFKITTGYTRVFLPRILVYIRYVWASSPYIRPFRSRIFAFLNGHIFA